MPARRFALLAAAFILPGVFLGTAFAMGRQPGGASKQPAMIYVAHAGGGFQGCVHTSSMEAMEKSYAEGYRIFELDVEFTSDKRVVLVHDWGTFSGFSYLNHWPTYDEYVHAQMKVDFRPPTLDGLQAFLKAHPDTFVIIDSKRAHLIFLDYIAKYFPAIVPQAMPYVYSEGEYGVVRRLGYRNIVFGAYQSPLSDDQIIHLVERHPFFAVSMPADRPGSRRARRCENRWCLPQELNARGVKLILHVINRRAAVEWARNIGVSGVMSDWLVPSRDDVRRTEKFLRNLRRHPI